MSRAERTCSVAAQGILIWVASEHSTASTSNGLNVETLLLRIAEKKLADQGIVLGDAQLDVLRSALQGREISSDTEVELLFADADLSAIDRELRGALKKLPSIVDDYAPALVRALDRGWKAEQKRQRRTLRSFSRQLRTRWREPLTQLEQFIVACTDLGQTVNSRLRSRQPCPEPHLVEAQTRLHARACQTAWEVLTLLSAGFAEGAMARWRALHEMAVVSMFIGQDEDLAERYCLHEAVESLRIARQYRQHTVKLNLDPLTDAEVDALEKTVAGLEQRFGKDYRKPYGWASGRSDFASIEADISLDHLRPYYKLASHSVHANPKGVFFRLGLDDHQSDVLLAGPSSIGLSQPGQNTAISLGQITASLCTLRPNLDSLAISKAIILLGERTMHGFASADADSEAEITVDRGWRAWVARAARELLDGGTGWFRRSASRS